MNSTDNNIAIESALDYLSRRNTEIKTYYIDRCSENNISRLPNFTGIYFVACKPHLIYIGCSDNFQRDIANKSQTFLACCKKLGNEYLSVTCVHVDDLLIAGQMLHIFVNQMNPLINVRQLHYSGAKEFQELTKLIDDRFYESTTILFNGFRRFIPGKLTKQFLIYAIQHYVCPDIDIKLLAYAPFWEKTEEKEMPPHYGGGEVSFCRPMIDAELKQLYAIRGYDQKRLQQVLAKNQGQREMYLKELLKVVNSKRFNSVEIRSFTEFLKLYCTADINLRKRYTSDYVPHKVELLLYIASVIDHAQLLQAIKLELRQFL